MEETKCNPAHCPYAKGHFDRVNDAVYELWTSSHVYDRQTILGQAEKRQVCPFEMCLDLALWVDAVICDYNYVFDPIGASETVFRGRRGRRLYFSH